MFSLSLNMKFWDDGQPDSTRIRNVNYSWNQLKKLTKFLKDNGLIADCFLYDFSPNKIIDESIHISYSLGEYKKAEKTNIILKERTNYDFFMMVDCDAFFNEDDYSNFLTLFKSLEENNVVTFDLAKLNENVSDYLIDGIFHKEKSDWSYAYSGDKSKGPLSQHVGGLGGVYMCYTKLLLNLGGFDEKYVGWGGEDGDMMDRIWKNGFSNKIKPIRNFAPFHLPHYSDWGNINYNKRFLD